MLRTLTKKALLRMGYVVSRYDRRRDFPALRRSFLESHGISVVFDIGANRGQFAAQLRENGYAGRIVSFEPLAAPYAVLAGLAEKDPRWDALHCALGSETGAAQINVSANSWSSSLLDILPKHVESAPESAYVGKETIEVRTLDSLLGGHCAPEDRIFLKIDTQGFGEEVLNGAQASLPRVTGIQLEMSLVPLYRDEPLVADNISFLYQKGFTLVALEPEYFDRGTNQLLQVNGLFFRTGP